MSREKTEGSWRSHLNTRFCPRVTPCQLSRSLKHRVLLYQCLTSSWFTDWFFLLLFQLEKTLSSFWRGQMRSRNTFFNGKRYVEKIAVCMFNVSLFSVPLRKLLTTLPVWFTLQSYNDVAEDMRGDEDTKSELHQQLDVRNTNTFFIVWVFCSSLTTPPRLIVNFYWNRSPISVFL